MLAPSKTTNTGAVRMSPSSAPAPSPDHGPALNPAEAITMPAVGFTRPSAKAPTGVNTRATLQDPVGAPDGQTKLNTDPDTGVNRSAGMVTLPMNGANVWTP